MTRCQGLETRKLGKKTMSSCLKFKPVGGCIGDMAQQQWPGTQVPQWNQAGMAATGQEAGAGAGFVPWQNQQYYNQNYNRPFNPNMNRNREAGLDAWARGKIAGYKDSGGYEEWDTSASCHPLCSGNTSRAGERDRRRGSKGKQEQEEEEEEAERIQLHHHPLMQLFVLRRQQV